MNKYTIAFKENPFAIPNIPNSIYRAMFADDTSKAFKPYFSNTLQLNFHQV